MKSNKGFTLLELLICVTMVSVVVVFLFKLINDVQNEKLNTPYIPEVYSMRNEIMNKIGNVINKYGVCSSNTSESTSDRAVVKLSMCNGKLMTLTVTSKAFQIDYDGESNIYKIDKDNVWFDPAFVEENDVYQKYEYYILTFKTHKKGHEDTVLDDIAISYGYMIDDGTPTITTSYDCTFENEQGCNITVEKAGVYRVEAWGGKGDDNIGVEGGSGNVPGGLGGYAYGELRLDAGQTVYAGLSLGGHIDDPSFYGYGADGGDGVFLAYNKVGDGYLTDYDSYRGELIIVSGGGGGGSSCFGLRDDPEVTEAWRNTASGKNANRGTTASRTFGKGQTCTSDSFWCGGEGGGGYYGGSCPCESFYACGFGKNRRGGYGGIGYLNVNVLHNAILYSTGSDAINNTIAWRTAITDCVGYAQSKCMNNGGPYLKLTLATQDS